MLPTKHNLKPWAQHLKYTGDSAKWSGEGRAAKGLRSGGRTHGEFPGFLSVSYTPDLELKRLATEKCHRTQAKKQTPTPTIATTSSHNKSLLSLAQGAEKGRQSKTENLWTITALLQPNNTGKAQWGA